MSRPSLILPPGSQLGGFEIEDVLGVGGMAVVYRAVQQSLGRRVALKVLNPRLAADSTFRERFRREGALVATLDHPGIIPVYDSGEVDGRLYLAMRLIDGDTLAEHMAQGLSATETVRVLAAVGAALDAAHDAGLLHRDVKPQNILLSATGHVYLADFGVAKGAGASDLTATQGFLGSVNYVAPEQIRGDPVGPPADVYALAIVAHECFTGQAPFARDTEAAVIHAHLSDPPPPLVSRDQPWTAALSDALARGLAKAPEDRPATSAAFVHGLNEALSGAPAAVLDRAPAFPLDAPADRSSQSAAGVAAGADQGRPPVRPIGVPAAGAVSVAAGQAAPAPAPASAPPVSERVDMAAPVNPTIHDRRRSEFVPAEAVRTKADRWYALAPWIALVIAAVIPISVAALTGSKRPVRSDLGVASAQAVEGWAVAPAGTLTTAQTSGLALDGPKALRAPKGGAVVIAGTLTKTSGLAPQSLGKGERAMRLAVEGGTVRQWSLVRGPQVRRIAVASTGAGAVAVVCSGPVATVTPACDEIVGSLKADHGALSADPDPTIAKAVATALSATASARKTVLPVKDRAARATDARKIAAGYVTAAALISKVDQERDWDRDLLRLEAGLTSASRAFVSFDKAAQAKDTSRDKRAQSVLRAANASIDTALGRLQRRGYTVKGLG